MIKVSPSLKLRSAGKKRSSAGRHAYVRHFVPGYPVGLGVDTRTKVAEAVKVRGAGVRLRLQGHERSARSPLDLIRRGSGRQFPGPA